MAGTNELNHLRKSAEDAIIEVQSISDICCRERRDDYAAAPLANARAMLYLAEVIRAGLESMVWSDVKQDVVKSGPAPGWMKDDAINEADEHEPLCVDCGKPAHPGIGPCNDCGKRLCWDCNFTHEWKHAIDVAVTRRKNVGDGPNRPPSLERNR